MRIALAIILFAALLVSAFVLYRHKGERMDDPAHRKPAAGQPSTQDRTPPAGKNRLVFEQSPYLRQHADNPVDWYPWGEVAFARAKADDKPIFLSIGYSTCHWCHVMEHESFEDSVVAGLMNDAFVNIKVDREERPDIDGIYMTVCQMLTGSGGWPLTVLLTPEREPFYAATYIPREAMLRFIPQVTQLWAEDRQRLLDDASRVTEALDRSTRLEPGDALGEAVLADAYDQMVALYDSTHGGFGTAPKFPTPHNLSFMLRQRERRGDPRALEMVEKTLGRMRRGGMYDHVGFGFHRYSTDARWFLPHFEKMLYDQALLAIAYTEAYQVTGKSEYRRTAEEIFTYVLRDMTDEKGGFYSAEDADSEGEEGKFYLWGEDELRSVLGDTDADLIVSVFGVEAGGNYREEASGHQPGTNILYLPKPLEEAAAGVGTSEADLRDRWASIREKLFAAREKRVHPHKDDKILADWNGLMIAALAIAGRALGVDEYTTRATRAARFVMKEMARDDGGLFHRYRGGDASIAGMADDYAFFVWGLLELHQATHDAVYLAKAVAYTDYMIDKFWDESGGGFFFTPDDGETLIVRQKEVYDGAIPSGNSVAMLNLIRIARMTANTDYEEKARAVGKAFAKQVAGAPAAFTQLMTAVDFMVGPSVEVVVAGAGSGADTRAMLSALESAFVPNKVVLLRAEEAPESIVALAPWTESHRSVDGKATAYVCRNFACELPTTNIDEMMALIESDGR